MRRPTMHPACCCGGKCIFMRCMKHAPGLARPVITKLRKLADLDWFSTLFGLFGVAPGWWRLVVEGCSSAMTASQTKSNGISWNFHNTTGPITTCSSLRKRWISGGCNGCLRVGVSSPHPKWKKPRNTKQGMWRTKSKHVNKQLSKL